MQENILGNVTLYKGMITNLVSLYSKTDDPSQSIYLIRILGQIIDVNIPVFMKEKRKKQDFVGFYMKKEKQLVMDREMEEEVRQFQRVQSIVDESGGSLFVLKQISNRESTVLVQESIQLLIRLLYLGNVSIQHSFY